MRPSSVKRSTSGHTGRVVAFARLVSIFGHPALLAPAAAMFAFSGSHLLLPVSLILFVLVLGTMGYAFRQVRAGHWRHVDASDPGERRGFNPVLVSSFVLAAVLASQLAGAPPLVVGFLSAACIPVSAMLLSRRVKPSQHVAFAVHTAAWLLAFAPALAIAAFGMSALIAWSRLALGRHTFAEVLVGAAIGAAAGLLLLAYLN